MATKIEAVKTFLTHVTHPDLAAMFNENMECQVNVAADGGQRIDGEYKGRGWHGWTDDVTTWKSFRIPWNASQTPTYTDSEIRFDLAQHAEGIGLTGWDWRNRVSRWVAFDFDSITTHRVGLSDTELKSVFEAVKDIDWVTVRKSTSGKGYHLYVKLTPTITRNHTEHAALGRAVLGHMSAISGFDFRSKVDACGGNMWVWHRKMDSINRPITDVDGLKLLKKGSVFTEIPENWRDHLAVISGRKAKTLPSFVDVETETRPQYEEEFEELCGQCIKVALDEDHKKLLQWLSDNGHYWEWNQDLWMLISHTASLKEAHTELGLKGIFHTTSAGTERGMDKNCFCFPMRRGAWSVRRYSPGISEAPNWAIDNAGWTTCYLNREPDLATAARTKGGIEHPKGGFVFSEGEMARQAAELLGGTFDLPPMLTTRQTTLLPSTDGRLIVKIKHEPSVDRPGDMNGWIQERGMWLRVLNVQASSPHSPEIGNYDDIIRHIVSESNEDAGWVLRSSGTWVDEPVSNIKPALKALGYSPKELDVILGAQVIKCWTLTLLPFQPEYPGDRKWNRNAPQLKYLPSEDLDNLHYPTWMKILTQCGRGLDLAVKDDNWCKTNGINSGADYLMVWVASMIQRPMESLPYLFFYSKEQGSGKSMFHESISRLMIRGHARADNALMSTQGYNAEIARAVFCIVEETDLGGAKSKTAYNKIKDWVTSSELAVHQKYETPCHVPNCTHWVQCANDAKACPIFPGDTRIVAVEVPVLKAEDMVPKRLLQSMLDKEASDFIAALMNLSLPESNDRLSVPVIATSLKRELELQFQNEVEEFLNTGPVYKIPGAVTRVEDLYNAFHDWLEPTERTAWTQRRFSLCFNTSGEFPKGRWSPANGNFFIGNISLMEVPPMPRCKTVPRKGYDALVREE